MSTAIPWVRNPDGTPGEVWNPVRGCSPASEGCFNCWAARYATRFSGFGLPYEGLAENGKWTGEVRTLPERLGIPLRWRRPRTVFVNSTSDLFHDAVPDEFIAAVFGVMAACPRHRFLILTKRTKRARRWFEWMNHQDPDERPLLEACWQALRHEAKFHPEGDGGPLHTKYGADSEGPWPLPNIWLGVTVENGDNLSRIERLLDIPAAVRFVSNEPMLGPIGLSRWLSPCSYYCDHEVTEDGLYGHRPERGIDWVICGSESGPGARPFDEDWARSLRDQCVEASVPFFYKQGPDSNGKTVDMPELDGKVWDQFPGAK